ncbi:hypothetical protein C8F01DRAFT_1148552 [Mycena amicta]|nr:hypothetical protein C8F01DRAFT_1148552 [Mycena amicta]
MSSSASQTPASVEPVMPNFAPIVTSQLIGSLLNFFFAGVLVVQIYVYRLCFPKDSIFVKLLVYFVFLAVLVSAVLNAIDVQFWYAEGFGNIVSFADPRNGRFYTPIMGSFIAFLVQAFFCYRIFIIKRTAWPISVLILIVSMTQCAGGMGCGIIAYMKHNGVHDHTRDILIYFWLVGGALADVVIAAIMSFLLLRAAASRETRDMVKNVVRLIVETNVFSSVIAILGLLLYVAFPNTTYFVAPTMILPGIYANTLLVTLNNRAAIANMRESRAVSSDSGFGAGLDPSRASASSRTPFNRPSGNSTNEPMSFAVREVTRDQDGEAIMREKSGTGIAGGAACVRSSLEGNQWRDTADESGSDYGEGASNSDVGVVA